MMVKTGLERYLANPGGCAKGLRVGLVAHPASVLPNLTHACEGLLHAGVKLTTLFSAEHGLAGTADSAVPHSRDLRSGLPVYSLYGKNLQPTEEMMKDVDLLIFDMQDVGSRFFTYISTLFYCLKGAAQAGKPMLVLDRPNPINGRQVEGPMLQKGVESFVGIAALPIRHGLTLGEAALYLNGEYRLGAAVQVLTMQGWQREMWFEETRLPWVPPSPAMPHMATALVYPGTCLLEGTNLSEGRGTYLPFEQCGAPWVIGDTLADRLNSRSLESVRFRPTAFVPRNSKYAGELCGGVQLHVLDKESFRPVKTAITILSTIQDLYPNQFTWNEAFDRLAGTDQVRLGICAGKPVEEITLTFSVEVIHFENLRKPYLRY